MHSLMFVHSLLNDRLAQLVERIVYIDEVVGSRPTAVTKMNNKLEYYIAIFFRKIEGFLWGNPEFRFLFKILLGILGLAILYLIFKAKFG